MDDRAIIELYWQRAETAIVESHHAYGAYCHSIAMHILHSREDAEECVNDTWLAAWKAIPPARPQNLKGFFGSITRHIALDRYDREHAKKRDGVAQVAEEFWDCVPDTEEPILEEIIFKERINAFLGTLDRETRIIFLQRYWYMCPVRDIARRLHMKESHVRVILYRTREKLRVYLGKEGVTI